MGPEIDALFFGLAVSLIAFVAALVAPKILRRCGVIPYPPFKFRKEYLEAALEMDLDVFIERAKATPKSVLQKSPLPMGSTFSGALQAIAKEIADDISLPVKNESEAPQTTSERAKWFRVTAGSAEGILVRRSVLYPSLDNMYDGSAGSLVISKFALEPAYPKVGEWWRWTTYDLGSGRPLNLLPFCWTDEWRDYADQVSAGLLEPVNYGKGN